MNQAKFDSVQVNTAVEIDDTSIIVLVETTISLRNNGSKKK